MNSAQSVAACAAVIDAADISSVPALLSSSDEELDSARDTTLSTAPFTSPTSSLLRSAEARSVPELAVVISERDIISFTTLY